MQTDPELEQTFTSHTNMAYLKNPLSNKENDINIEDEENINLTKKQKLNNDNTAQLVEKVLAEKENLPIKTTGNSKQANSEGDTPKALGQSNERNGDLVLSSSQSRQASSERDIHELVITEESLELIRNYIEHHKMGVDLYQFDCDEEYQKAVLYR